LFRFSLGRRSNHCRGASTPFAFTFILLVTLTGAQPVYAIDLDPANVLVLYNVDSPEGIEIANYYAQVHPGVQLLGLEGVSTQEQVNQSHYLNEIRPQVLAGLGADTEVIVTTKGLPLRIENNAPNPGNYPGWRGQPFGVPILDDWWENYSSLESELTRIDRINSADMMGDQASFMSPPSFPYTTMHHAANPYYNANQAFDRDNAAYEGIRLTARLDGFAVDDVIASIDRAQTAFILPTQQLVIVDDDPNTPAAGVDRMASLAFDVLEPNGQALVFDGTTADVIDAPRPVIGYVSHGSHAAGSGYIDNLEFDLADGAVFHTWESFNAYSFEEDNNLYGQGLIGEWIEAGGTAGLGHVQEPSASAANVANEDILWDMLLQGYTYAEAAWAATPQLSFVNTVVGDPLMVLRPWVQGDANLDGIVGLDDLNLVLTQWNQSVTGGIVEGDLDGDNYVGIKDINILLSKWQADNQSAAPLVIPEPAAVWTVVCGVGLMMRRHAVR
jgi:uncharacterized protein (TIGR03790 family)